MKKWVLHTIMVGLWSLLSVSCAQEEEEVVADDVKVSFILSMGNTTGSRGVNISKEEGNDYENTIDLNDVQVYIYDAKSGSYIDEVHSLNVIPDVDKKTYRITGYLTAAYSNFKIMVFANCGKIDPKNPFSFIFDYNTKNIPMWGVTTVEQLKEGTNNITISLLRAMAKVEVKLSDRSIGCTLESVAMTRYNEKGFCVPGDFMNMNETADVDYVTLPSDTLGSDLSFTKVNEKNYILYLPEYRNERDKYANISVSVKDINGTYHSETIRMGKYDSGKFSNEYWNIIRNHYYSFNLLLNVAADGKLNLNVETENYAEWELFPSYGE